MQIYYSSIILFANIFVHILCKYIRPYSLQIYSSILFANIFDMPSKKPTRTNLCRTNHRHEPSSAQITCYISQGVVYKLSKKIGFVILYLKNSIYLMIVCNVVQQRKQMMKFIHWRTTTLKLVSTNAWHDIFPSPSNFILNMLCWWWLQCRWQKNSVTVRCEHSIDNLDTPTGPSHILREHDPKEPFDGFHNTCIKRDTKNWIHDTSGFLNDVLDHEAWSLCWWICRI